MSGFRTLTYLSSAPLRAEQKPGGIFDAILHANEERDGFFPIDDNATWEKNAATVRQLYKLRERIRSLERQLSTLTASK